jgi:TetR/AcrR family transcriptional repressor of nem operon
MDDNASRSVGRPAGFERGEAVRAAMHLLWKRGYLSVTARELADAIGVQRSSFYNSFGSRAKLFAEVLAMYAAEAPDAALDRVVPGDPVLPVVAQVFRHACRACAADEQARGCLVCNSVSELVGVEAKVGELVAAGVEARIASFERLLRQAVKQGEMPAPPDIKAAARATMAFLVGLNTLSKIVRSERQLWSMSCAFLAAMGMAVERRNPPPTWRRIDAKTA